MITGVKRFIDPGRLPNTRPRGGVIPYFRHNGQIYFCLGIDSRTRELTDFGGGLELQDSGFIECAKREFTEETLGIFGEITDEDWDSSIVLYNRLPWAHRGKMLPQDMIIILLEVKGRPEEYCRKYQEKYHTSIKNDQSKFIENKSIIWVSLDQLRRIIEDKFSQKMYQKVKEFLVSFKQDLCPRKIWAQSGIC